MTLQRHGAAMFEIDTESDALDDLKRDLRAFVGKKADYYLSRWGLALRGGGSTGFNWAACFFGCFWLPYRKMYLIAIVFYGIIAVETVLEEVLFVGVLGEPEVSAGLDRLVALVTGIVIGSFGNRWYLSHAKKAVADVRELSLDEEAAIELLSRRGGTSLGAAFGFMLLFLLLLFGALIIVDIVLFGL